VFAIPGIGALIVFVLSRPQEFFPLLQRVPFLHLFTALAVLGFVIDLRLQRLQPVACPTLPWVIVLFLWIIAGTAAGPVILATVGANEIVGEMGILCNAPRNATVRAKDRLIALRISKELFMRMVREFPNIAVSIMQELAHRLEANNNQLRAALAETKRLRETAGIAA
jgi:Cyclic nucleotide-binding domain